LRHPLLAFDKIRAVCRGAALVETHVCNVDPMLPSSLFYLDNVLDKATTNWTGPSESCVASWMRDAEFQSVWAEITPRMPTRQRFVGFVEEPTFRISSKFKFCDDKYFALARLAVERALKAGVAL
jgi:tRNA (mo5U34)-methyltransferase